ncbi:hypothetical protein [Cellulomonas dongxiuzhuiae]|uniref:hypothetical protein n=1 Tax=Cellulomonas dongxiuzhuiae TaxID=2819979 RepID=UPI001AAE5391|nr:hypothetical protein [Cellulomonas dongxiuzhuiae]MBO3088669.1 hypothetical protein [Cellulomonas dongxiuzhuiae]
MNEHLRAVPGSPGDDPGTPPSTGVSRDLLAERIAASLRSREALAPDPVAVAAAVEQRMATSQRPSSRLLAGRGARIAAAGVVTSGLAIAGAGAAAATHPYSPMARTVENVVQAVGIDWSAMPDGYTREQYEALWGAGYEMEDVTALEELWGTDTTETKARAGQLLLDGRKPPVAPGTVAPGTVALSTGAPGTEAPGAGATAVTGARLEALWAAGYVWEDALALADLWDVDVSEAKARAAVAVAQGQALPLPPSGPPGGDG